jgi:hypothetical protein
MPIRTSKTEHEYPYGHRRQVGDRFDVDDKDVPVLLVLGRIDPEAGEAGFVPHHSNDAGRSSYPTREMTAGSTTVSRKRRTA